MTFREERLAALSPYYRPTLHVLFPMAWATLVILGCALLLEGVRAIDFLTIPVVLVLSNATEWRLHKDALHQRWYFAPSLYDQHTPVHHRIYTYRDMEMKDRRELAFILILPWAGVALFVALLPIAAALGWLLNPNVGLLFMATCMFYVVSYELLHMSYHLPRTSMVGRNAVIRALARHHSVHHDPRYMQTHNMNVTLPLWDVVRGTRMTHREPVVQPVIQ
jgi:hypothetical protein